jgi:hypothetical protein
VTHVASRLCHGLEPALLTQHIDALNRLTAALLEQETIGGDQVRALVRPAVPAPLAEGGRPGRQRDAPAVNRRGIAACWGAPRAWVFESASGCGPPVREFVAGLGVCHLLKVGAR